MVRLTDRHYLNNVDWVIKLQNKPKYPQFPPVVLFVFGSDQMILTPPGTEARGGNDASFMPSSQAKGIKSTTFRKECSGLSTQGLRRCLCAFMDTYTCLVPLSGTELISVRFIHNSDYVEFELHIHVYAIWWQ